MNMLRLTLNLGKTSINLTSGGITKQGINSFKTRAAGRVVKDASQQMKTVEKTHHYGRMAMVGGATCGIGALCYYGLSTQRGSSAIDRAMYMWPPIVQERVRTTYSYFAASVGITAASVVALMRNTKFVNGIMRVGPWGMIGGCVLTMATGMATMALPYEESGNVLNLKHLSWAIHSACVAALISPICIIGGPIIARAVMYTGGIVGGLSAIAMTAPSDKFLYMGGPLAIGFGVVLVSNIAAMFLSPVSVMGNMMGAITLYGGTLLFSGFLLYDTQKVVHRAENHPVNAVQMGMRPFDPINNAMSIYTDTINLFIRIATMLMMNNRKK